MRVQLDESSVYFYYRESGIGDFLEARSTNVERTQDDWVIFTLIPGTELEVEARIAELGIDTDPFNTKG